jgi:hypothetical protein
MLVLLMGGMKCAVEMVSLDMLYIPSVMRIGSGIQGILTILDVVVSV